MAHMESSWPTSWQGTTNIDCGEDGCFMTYVTTNSRPSGAHARTYELICSRWEVIWPEFKTIITELMVSYGRVAPEWTAVRSIYISVPDEPIAEDAEWWISVAFSTDETAWLLPYNGWCACPDLAQAVD